MLSRDDRRLADRDGEIPDLAVVLDPTAVADWIRRAAGTVTRIGATHVRYKPGTSCVVGYEVTTPSGTRLVFAKAVRAADAHKVDKAVEKAVGDVDAGWDVVRCSERCAYVATALNDRDLPSARTLADPAARQRLLDRLLPTAEDPGDRRLRAIRHKPERRWVGVVDVDGRPAHRFKAYRPVDVARAHAGHAVVGATWAAPTAWSRRRGVIVSPWIDGASMADALVGGGDVDAWALGASLAELHGRPPAPRVRTIRERELRRGLRSAVAAVEHVLPGLGPTAQRIARRAGRVVREDAQRSPIHGDLSADQVVLTTDGLHLIDFDDAANGQPAADLASFAADLLCAEVGGRVRPGRCAEVTADLLEGYRHAGGRVDPTTLDAHLSRALLHRAVEPFRARRPHWRAECEQIVEAAIEPERRGVVGR